MQRITAKGIALIKKFEGFSRHSYTCPAGYQTIGYGHLLKKEESYTEGISEKAAEALLAQDIRIAEDAGHKVD